MSIIALLRRPRPTLNTHFCFFSLRSLGLVLAICISLLPQLVLATGSLPALSNSADGDRVLLREISNTYVYATPATASINPPPEKSTDVWAFVQQSSRLEIPKRDAIAYYLKQYQREAIWITGILRRATPFIGHVVDELDKRYLPIELSLLPVIESGYQPDVHSPKKAAGIWQIVPATAAEVGIRQTPWFDGRSDIRESTQAAIDYLSYLNAEFHGDWQLTLAAYNAGPGRVRAAIRRNQAEQLPTDFWSLRLPSETQNYVPKYLALVAMLREDKAAGLSIPAVPRGSSFDVVDAKQRVSLDRLAQITGVDEDLLQQLNAGLVHGITPPAGPHLIYVPQGVGTRLVDLLRQRKPGTLYTAPDSHVVSWGDTLSAIALRYQVPLGKLKEINELESDFIRPGQTLRVRNFVNEHERMEYVVTIGDSLTEIAQRFEVSVTAIRDEQGRQLRNDIIHPGERLSLLIDDQRKPVE